MYRALYRKYRPQKFSDVVGQEAITSALQNQIMADKIGHAYLFTGTRGTGKTTCAKIFAKAVNCENCDGANPCGECDICVGIENGSILDVIEIDAASNNSVDDVRDLRDETAYRPSRCRFKVYIIDEVHMLSTSAFNALLKILEEPPSHVIFILATTEIHKVPATILSRCQRFDFMRIPAEKIAERLLNVAEEENISLTPEAAGLIARLADGALRDALSLLDTCSGMGQEVDENLVRRMAGVADKDYLFAVSSAVVSGGTRELIELVASLRSQSIEVKRLTEELISHYRNFILALAQPSGSLLDAVSEEEKQRYLAAAREVGEPFAIQAVRRLTVALDKMSRSPNARVELELALFDLNDLATREAGEAQPPKASTTQKTAGASPVATAPKPAPPAAAIANTAKEETIKQPVAAPGDALSPPETPAKAAGGNTPAEAEISAKPEEVTGGILEEKATASLRQNTAKEQAMDIPHEAQTASPPSTINEPAALSNDVATATPSPIVQESSNTPSSSPDASESNEPQPFSQWPEVVASMADTDRMLYSYMKDSTAYLDGKRILIDGGEMFLSFMREYDEAGEKIKNAIAGVTGTRYAIGPYSGPAKDKGQKTVTAQDTLREWEAKGIPVEYQ